MPKLTAGGSKYDAAPESGVRWISFDTVSKPTMGGSVHSCVCLSDRAKGKCKKNVHACLERNTFIYNYDRAKQQKHERVKKIGLKSKSKIGIDAAGVVFHA